jgi:hypothetical protein
MATITVTKGHNAPTGFVTGETVTPATLNAAQTPVVAISNIVDADLSASAGITAGKLASTLDLTGKTVTLPATSVTTASIAGAAVTAAKLDGAQTGSAPIYGCRAWVNFDGTTADNIGGTYSRTGTTVTVDTTVAHGLKAGHKVQLDFTSGVAADGAFTVLTAPTTTQFTVTHGTSGTTSGNVTLPRRAIRASGNVASVTYYNAVGIYAVNFSTALPDENYALAGFANHTTANVAGLVSGNNTHAQTAMACDVRVANSTTAAELNVSYVNVMFIR